LLTFGFGSVEPDALSAANAAASDVQEYFSKLCQRRRAHPGNDMLSEMLRSDQDELSEAEWTANTVLLFGAGHETTVNLLGNGMLALMTHAACWQDLCADPRLAVPVVDEALRYDSPMQVISRSALADLEIAGYRIESGDHVALLLGSANRDPARFDNPDVFDPHRQSNHPLSFGAGLHYCLGARLARIEAAAAFNELAVRLAGLRLADERPQHGVTSSHRGLVTLPLICTATR
jgi:cytochrome P450